MITNAYNYLNFPPLPAQILLNLGKKRGDDYKCLQLLKFSPCACPNLVEFREVAKEVILQMLTITYFFPFACPNLVEFREIAKEVMITNAYNYLNFPLCLPKSC